MLLQDCATDMLLKDCHSDMFFAANILVSQESLSYSQDLPSGDVSNYQTFYNINSSGGSTRGRQEILRQQTQYKNLSNKFVPTDRRETYRRSKLGQHKKGWQNRGPTRPKG